MSLMRVPCMSAEDTSSGKKLYGAPQTSIENAQKYVKSNFFYSTRKGDKADGEPLTDTSEAMNIVKANRNGYYEEVVSAAYGQATEELTTGAKEDNETLKELIKKASTVETYDDKKAVGVLITYASAQARVKRLSLDLSMLELEAVSLLKSLPADYIVARSSEEIDAETEENINGGKEK